MLVDDQCTYLMAIQYAYQQQKVNESSKTNRGKSASHHADDDDDSELIAAELRCTYDEDVLSRCSTDAER